MIAIFDEPMNKSLEYYKRKFAPRSKNNPSGLNVSRKNGIALNKPILLLAVIELIDCEKIKDNCIELSPELVATFLNLWGTLDIDRNPDIGLPFFHLKNDGFWFLRFFSDYGFLLSQSQIQIRTLSSLKQCGAYAYFEPELFEYLKKSDSRRELTDVLIKSWFANKIDKINKSFDVNIFEKMQEEFIEKGGEKYSEEEIKSENEVFTFVRDSRFRRGLVRVYNYRCAFCHLQVLYNQENIVDGSHIKPFSLSYDDSINNGISLCKNHHWAFDRFWFTIKEDFTIEVSNNLIEQSSVIPFLNAFQGRRILLPEQAKHHPSLTSLQWHRESFINKQGSIRSNMI